MKTIKTFEGFTLSHNKTIDDIVLLTKIQYDKLEIVLIDIEHLYSTTPDINYIIEYDLIDYDNQNRLEYLGFATSNNRIEDGYDLYTIIEFYNNFNNITESIYNELNKIDIENIPNIDKHEAFSFLKELILKIPEIKKKHLTKKFNL
jgi:hypothetical protein